MSDDKKSNLNRRDFLTGGVGAIVGASLMGITDKAEKSKNNNSNARSPAQADPRNIANNFSTLQKHYPILIIGSGYGGSVLAARLSSTGKQVCIFERGKEWHPGMFPKSGENLTNSQRAPLTPKGLIDNNAHIKSDVDIICASGLGGTSLLNAAIATRPEDLVFQQDSWPKEIREAHQAGILQKYMDKAQGVLGSTHHPDAMKMKKTQTLQKIAAQFGHKTQELLLNINHSKDKSIQNEYGVPQKVFATYAKLNPHLFTQEQLKRIHSDFNNFDPKNDGAIGNSMLFFACGHDSSGGTYKLDSFEDKVHVKWPNVVDEKGFQTINRELAKYAKAQGGIYIPNPRMTTFGHRMMATHPLDGCPMGEDAQTGVVDHLGRVFSEDGSIHKSFFIVDASIIPHSLGATPLITISALAERIADFINGHQSIAL